MSTVLATACPEPHRFERLSPVDDVPERIELIDYESEPLVPYGQARGLRDGQPHPGRDQRLERSDLLGLVRQEEHATVLSDPLPHRKLLLALLVAY